MGRWKDLNGRFAAPPSPRDEVITQEEARSRRSSRGTSPTPATEMQRDEQRDRDRADSAKREQRAPSAARSGSRTKKIKDIDRSWEKVTHADVDAATQAANAGSSADQTNAATAAAATVHTAPPTAGAENAQDDGTKREDAENANIQQAPGTSALGSDVERSTISEQCPATEKSSLNTET